MRAVITGAKSGIGLATAKLFYDNGYDITSVDINNQNDNDIWHFIGKDLWQGKFTVDYPVDVLICSHGVGGLGRTPDQVIGVNVIGTINAVESVLPKMRKGSSIVLVASMTGPVVGNRGMKVAHYAASKGAVAGYARQLAVELAPEGIQVNAIAPGPVVTPMTDNLLNKDPELYSEFFLRCILDGGPTMPEDIADAILGIVGIPRMTGQIIVVDGGYSIH